MTTQKNPIPLVAKLQSSPDAAWGPLLENIEEAKRRYDPETQTSDYATRDGAFNTYRASGSGGATSLSAEDGGKGETQDHSEKTGAYRPATSGGPTALGARDTGKRPLPKREGDYGAYRSLSSGGATLFTDDGGKE